MYLARELTHESLSDIGRFFGGRTHSTVKHAVERVGRQLESDQEMASFVERCRRQLEWV
jgi:chromosomal replication initiator protein